METTGDDLNRANKALTSAKKHAYGIIFLELDHSNLSLAVFHDASFRNLLDG